MLYRSPLRSGPERPAGSQTLSISDYYAQYGADALQVMIDSAAPTDAKPVSIYIPQGRWMLNPVSMKSNIRIFGAGALSVLQMSDPASRVNHENFFTVNNCSNVTFESLQIDHDAVIPGGAAGEAVDFSNCVNCVIHNTVLRNSGQDGWDLDYCQGFVITNNITINCGKAGIHVSSHSRDNFIGWNFIDGMRDTARGALTQVNFAHNNTYIGNHVRLTKNSQRAFDIHWYDDINGMIPATFVNNTYEGTNKDNHINSSDGHETLSPPDEASALKV